MGVSAGDVKAQMVSLLQKDLFAAAVRRLVGEYCKCNASQTAIQNQTPDMIAQSRPNVKYFLEAIKVHFR